MTIKSTKISHLFYGTPKQTEQLQKDLYLVTHKVASKPCSTVTQYNAQILNSYKHVKSTGRHSMLENFTAHCSSHRSYATVQAPNSHPQTRLNPTQRSQTPLWGGRHVTMQGGCREVGSKWRLQIDKFWRIITSLVHAIFLQFKFILILSPNCHLLMTL